MINDIKLSDVKLNIQIKDVKSICSALCSDVTVKDLTDRQKVLNYFKTFQFDYIIHLAANVGGLYKNLNSNIEMFSDNIKIMGLIGYIFIYAYISLKTSFYPYLIVDKNYGVINSIHSSFTKTNGFEFELFIIYVLLVFINILGVWGLMTGSIIFLFYFALFSMPFSLIVHSLVYTTYLSDQNHP